MCSYLKRKYRQLNKISFNEEHFVDKCGKSEDGYNNLTYKKDIFGFRQNEDHLFYDTDLVILGDSFGASNCVNYPNDLTSQLKNLLNTNKILNISVGGSDYIIKKRC